MTTIALCLGEFNDPGVRLRLSQAKEWLALWHAAADEYRRRTTALWPRYLSELLNASTRWRRVRGPTSATIATLFDVGFAG